MNVVSTYNMYIFHHVHIYVVHIVCMYIYIYSQKCISATAIAISAGVCCACSRFAHNRQSGSIFHVAYNRQSIDRASIRHQEDCILYFPIILIPS